MVGKIKKYIEPNKNIRIGELVIAIILVISIIFSFSFGINNINKDIKNINYVSKLEMYIEDDFEVDDEVTSFDVLYSNGDKQMVITYSQDEDVKKEVTAYEYEVDGLKLYFDHEDVSDIELKDNYKEVLANKMMPIFNMGIACTILLLALLIITYFSKCFSTYEKIWFISIMSLACIVSIIAPEESANGVNGIVIMLLYLLDTFFNILCELLISKQSRYNFLVSLLVEITEILISVVLMYRFASMAVTLLFWIPIDIISFINWRKHKDEEDDSLTVVRKLSSIQEIFVILIIIFYTMIVGYFISGLNIKTDFVSNDIKTIIIYLDACCSAVGIANGIFILLRLKEQWFAWYVFAFIEMIINILSGQYVLLILKLGYFTNTTYGYLKWNKYIKEHSSS
ncbi:MAG: nicotinamide mononucleotide transporter [Firmicutes bacterium]|nr:nicotinamide mononucleotide transporter [Candidatus Colivicinus equi]